MGAGGTPENVTYCMTLIGDQLDNADVSDSVTIINDNDFHENDNVWITA